jgi:hypothetical protein
VTLEQLKKEAEALSFEEKGRLAAYLVQLRNREDPEHRKELQRRLEDHDSTHWLTPSDFEKRLAGER